MSTKLGGMTLPKCDTPDCDRAGIMSFGDNVYCAKCWREHVTQPSVASEKETPHEHPVC